MNETPDNCGLSSPIDNYNSNDCKGLRSSLHKFKIFFPLRSTYKNYYFVVDKQNLAPGQREKKCVHAIQVACISSESVTQHKKKQ